MDYERKKLVAKGDQIFAKDGEYIASVSITKKAKVLLKNVRWEMGKESWLDYWDRTKDAREVERLKRVAFVEDLVNSYNYFYKL
jgi:NMD protein affecting ribosome stability and mRNA decay